MSTLSQESKDEIRFDLERIDELIETGIFDLDRDAPTHPLMYSALTELLICLRDLMRKAEMHATGITFSDDIQQSERVKNITDLVKFLRDTLCHPESDHRVHAQLQARIDRCLIRGKGRLISSDTSTLESQYDDDVAYFFGSQRIYLRRHILRAYKEAEAILRPFI